MPKICFQNNIQETKLYFLHLVAIGGCVYIYSSEAEQLPLNHHIETYHM